MHEQNARFDHLIHWVQDLDGAMAAYDELGLRTTAALTMPGFRNGAWGVDDSRYVELATVDDWDAAATSLYGEGLELLRPAVDVLGGSGPVTFAVDVADARQVAATLRAAGHDVAETEVRFEERNAGFVEVFARDLPAHFPFFITYDPPRDEIAAMRAAHREATGRRLDGSLDLVALLVHSPDPEAEARLLGHVLGVPADGTTVTLPGAEVRFAAGPGAGLHGIAVRGLDPSAAASTIDGLQIIPER